MTLTAATDFALRCTLQGLIEKAESQRRRDLQAVENDRQGAIVRAVLQELGNAGLLAVPEGDER